MFQHRLAKLFSKAEATLFVTLTVFKRTTLKQFSHNYEKALAKAIFSIVCKQIDHISRWNLYIQTQFCTSEVLFFAARLNKVSILRRKA